MIKLSGSLSWFKHRYFAFKTSHLWNSNDKSKLCSPFITIFWFYTKIVYIEPHKSLKTFHPRFYSPSAYIFSSPPIRFRVLSIPHRPDQNHDQNLLVYNLLGVCRQQVASFGFRWRSEIFRFFHIIFVPRGKDEA